MDTLISTNAVSDDMEMSDTARELLDRYLADGQLAVVARAEPEAEVMAALRASALAFLGRGGVITTGARVEDLNARLAWFERFLRLLPAAERQDWLRSQVEMAQQHAMAGAELHEDLEPLMFDASVRRDEQLWLQALWLSVLAPGPVRLDVEHREAELAEAVRWVSARRALRRVS